MKQFLLIFVLIFISCNDTSKSRKIDNSTKTEKITKKDIKLEIYNYDELKPLLYKQDNKVHVVNFWATWCGPCIKELPYFEQLQNNYKDKNVELLLVSLDFPRQYEKKLKPFLKKKQLKSKVVCLNDVDQNRWIPAIDSTWSGALPATIIYRGQERKFFEQSFTYEELENEVKQFIN